MKIGVRLRARKSSRPSLVPTFPEVTDLRMEQLYLITLHLFFTASGAAELSRAIPAVCRSATLGPADDLHYVIPEAP